MSKKKMGIEGVGPKIAIPAIVAMILSYYLTKTDPQAFRFASDKNTLMIPMLILLIPGLILWLASVVQLLINFPKGRLITTGVYAIFKNPLYASFIFMVIPALSLYLNSWLYLTGSAALMIGMSKFNKEETEYLKATFGQKYKDYIKKVLIKF